MPGSRDGVAAIVMAAGQGKRLKSRLPKVLHQVAGRPLVGHVLATLAEIGEVTETALVVSSMRTEFETALADMTGDGLTYAVQDPPNGTGDAARVGLEALSQPNGLVLVVPGDTPLLTSGTLAGAIEAHIKAAAAVTVVTARVADPTGYGRVIRDASGDVDRIVEDRDATDEERRVDEINGSAYVFDGAKLESVLGKLDRDNSQGEYYLTDAIELLKNAGEKVVAYLAHETELQGVNTRAQLANVAGLLRRRTAERWMDEGVSIVDPSTTYIDASVEIERDVVILPFTFLEGSTTVASGAELGPQARIVDSQIGPGATVSFAVVRRSTVGEEASIGPFASLRPGTRVGKRARVGTFVETKETVIGEGSKANHLAYLGDAEIGRGVNVGAGTITCNWDGQDKHKTVIDDDAYIGSDTMLVAPVHVHERAATGAGSVVRGDVPEDSLAVGVPARVIEGKGDKLGKKARPSDDAPAG